MTRAFRSASCLALAVVCLSGDPARLQVPQNVDWPTYNGQLSGNRHSALDQINTANVMQLAPKWTYSIGGPRALQGTPLVVNGVMYVTAVNEAQALDARTGRPIWVFKRPQ